MNEMQSLQKFSLDMKKRASVCQPETPATLKVF